MTKISQSAAAQRLLDLSQAADSFPAFVRLLHPNFKIPKFHEEVMHVLDQIEKGTLGKHKLMVNMPVRHGKSWLLSTCFPLYYMCRDPRRKILASSYGADLATTIGKDVRNLALDNRIQQIFPKFSMAKDSQAASDWMTTEGGKYFACGIDGSTSGRPANLLIWDDLLKNRADADSPTTRNKAWSHYVSALAKRLEPEVNNKPAIEIGVMCMTGDTKVSMADGTHKQLSNIVAGDIVLSYYNGVTAAAVISKASCQGFDDVITIKTGNHTVRANARHPLLTLQNGQEVWKKFGDIAIGDYLISPPPKETSAPSALSDEDAYTLGYLTGDGWVTINNKKNKKPSGKLSHTRSFVTCIASCPKFPERVSRVISHLEKKFSAKFKETKFGYYRCEKADLGRWLISFGMNLGAHNKRIPAEILISPPNVADAFLAGVLGADGCVNKKRTRQSIGLCNLPLLQDVRHLAQSLGYRATNIYSHNGVNQAPHSPSPKPYSYHLLSISMKKSPDRRASRVSSITCSGRELVYDLTVAETENFIADGVVSHNTRWHPDDPCGRIIDGADYKEGDWHHITLPAISKRPSQIKLAKYDLPPSDPRFLSKEDCQKTWPQNRFILEDIDTALWPERFPLSYLEKQRRLDPHEFSALFQQEPFVKGGNILKSTWWRIYKRDELPESFSAIIISADTAFKAKETSDYSVFIVMGITTGGDIYILDVIRDRMEYPELKRRTVIENAKWRGKGLRGFFIEDKASGQSLIQDLRREGGVSVIPVKTHGDKVSRLNSVSPLIEGGRVFIPEAAPWLDIFLDETQSFPTSKHDDQIDALSIGLDAASRMGIGVSSDMINSPIEMSGSLSNQFSGKTLQNKNNILKFKSWGE